MHPSPVSFFQIDYFNNQIIVDLVEQQHKGIFSVLDEACMNVGKMTDEVFLQGLNGKLAKHAHYTSRKVGCTKYKSDPPRLNSVTVLASDVSLYLFEDNNSHDHMILTFELQKWHDYTNQAK